MEQDTKSSANRKQKKYPINVRFKLLRMKLVKNN